jgi:hypothetical protein
MAAAKLTWRGPQVRAEIARRCAEALTEIDLRIETEAKAELYPGHGKVTGNLQRSIQGAPGRIEGKRVRGKVGTKGVRYARRIHRLYTYLIVGFRRVQPQAGAIVEKHVRGGA